MRSITACGAGEWSVRVPLGRDPVTGRAHNHHKAIRGTGGQAEPGALSLSRDARREASGGFVVAWGRIGVFRADRRTRSDAQRCRDRNSFESNGGTD